MDQTGSANVLSGTAIHASDKGPVRVNYTVTCDRDWACRAARVDRQVGADRVQHRLQRQQSGLWTVNDQPIGGGDEWLDIDLGFTPATNTLAINRLKLGVGDHADLTALWLDETTWTFRPLRQRYVRLSRYSYTYMSLQSGYETELTVNEFGLVRAYPGLWEEVVA